MKRPWRSLARNLRQGAVPLGLVVVAACAKAPDQTRSAVDWSIAYDSGAVRKITSAPTPCESCIKRSRSLLLGDGEGEGSLETETLAVIQDTAGRFWVGQVNTVKVYSSTGAFLRAIGRAGLGPLEFEGFARPLFRDQAGRVHIFGGNRRRAVVSPDFELIGDNALPVGVRDAASIPGTSRFVVNAWVPTPARIGLPIHIVEADTIVESFGGPTTNAEILTEFSGLRAIAVDPQARIFAANQYQLMVDVWTTTGRPVIRLEGRPLNDHRVVPGALSEDNPPPNKVFAIQADGEGRLWVLRWMRRPTWREWMIQRSTTNGRTSLQMKDPADSYQVMFSSWVDVIDLLTGQIVGSAETDDMLLGWAGPGLAFANRFRPDGTPQVAIWRLHFQPSSKAGGR